MLAPLYVFSMSQLMPAYNPEDARQINVNLLAGTYLRGTVLGQVTDTEAGAVQTITTTGVPTGGTFIVNVTPTTSGAPTTISLPWNATAAQAQALLDNVYGPGNTKATGGALPTGIVVTFVGALAAQPVAAFTLGANSLTGGASPAGAIAQTTVGAANTGTFGPYANGNSDGTQIAKGILQYPCTVDAAGNITIGGDIPGVTDTEAPIYYCGAFRCEELVGTPSAANLAVDFPGAHLAIGDLKSGVLILAG